MTLTHLALRNIAGNLFRSGAVLLCAVLVAGLGLSATLVVVGAQRSLRENLDKMGADLIVIPWGTMSEPTLSAHLMSMTTKRWMPRTYMNALYEVPGVAAVTPQLYLATLTDSPYCSLPSMFVVAYEPETDFVIRPWLAEPLDHGLRLGEAIAGSEVSDPSGGRTIQLFGYDLTLVRRLEPTGSDIDQAVFVTFQTAEDMADRVRGQPVPPIQIAPKTVSAAMVRVTMTSDAHRVSLNILESVSSVIPIESTGLFQTQRRQMIGLLRTVLGLLAGTWTLAVLVMGLVFSLAVNERRRQIAVMRALGARETVVLRTLLLESVILALAGGLCGTLLGVAGLVLFRPQIAGWAGLPIEIPSPPALAGLAAAGLLLTLGSVILAAWLPVRRISRQEPALAMRE